MTSSLHHLKWPPRLLQSGIQLITPCKNVRSMFSIFWQHIMFPWIDMSVMLLRSTKDILNSLIPLEDRD